MYWDDTAMVKVRRRGANMDVAERLEYAHVDPEDWRHQVEEVRAGRLDPVPILADLERKRREDPGCRRALFLFDAISRAAQ